MSSLCYGFIAANDIVLYSLNVVLTSFLVLTSLNEFQKGSKFGPINAFSVLLFIHFALPFFYESFSVSTYNVQYLTRYKYTVLLYVCAISLVLLLYSNYRFSRVNHSKLKYFSGNSFFKVVIIFLVIGYIARAYLISQNLYFQHSRGAESNLSDSLTLTWLIGFEKYPFYALIILSVARQEVILRFNRWYQLVFLLELVYWIPTGRKEEIIATIVFPIIVREFYQREKFLTLKNAMIAVIIVVVFPATRFIRSGLEILEFSASQKTLSISDVVGALPEAYVLGQDRIGEISNKLHGKEANPNIKRLSLVESVSGCLYIKDLEGYKYGESYLFLFVFPIPRFLWNDKPKSTHGVEFGRKIGLVRGADNSSISISYIGESIMNFGFAGLVVIFLFLEMVVRFYENARRRTYILPVLLYVMLFRVFLYQGGELAAYLAGFVKQIIILAPLLIYLRRGRCVVFKY